MMKKVNFIDTRRCLLVRIQQETLEQHQLRHSGVLVNDRFWLILNRFQTLF